MWDHWIVFNIPPNVKEIKENEKPEGLVGKNTRGNNTYGGPCPPDGEHRYFFTVYALDTILGLKEGATKAQIEKLIQDHIITQAVLIGKYERVK